MLTRDPGTSEANRALGTFLYLPLIFFLASKKKKEEAKAIKREKRIGCELSLVPRFIRFGGISGESPSRPVNSAPI